MSSVDGALPESGEPVGLVLARLRRAQRISGADLADRVGMSQPKISRIERGKGLPVPEDVGAIARALGAAEETVQALMRQADRAHDRMTDWRPVVSGLANRQERLVDWEAAAGEMWDFEPVILAGLLQTSGYARSVLTSFQRLQRDDFPEAFEVSVLAAVTARIGRQEALADSQKSFRFLFTEAALRTRICPPAEMLSQINHLRFLAQRPNVVLAVITDDAPIPIPPLHGFTLFDDDMVVIDVYTTGLVSRSSADVQQYRQVFELFWDVATDDIGPLCDRYEAYYIEQLTRRD
jgi:transcriptional regulator with XRE-family HTH domain